MYIKDDIHKKNICKHKKKLEMCQYDTDAPAQGHPHPHAGILQKMKLKKGHNSHNNWQILP